MIDRLPPEWLKAILKLRLTCPSAVLAGGALRDLDNNGPVKDFDVFIHAQKAGDADDAMAALTDAGFTVLFDPNEETAYPQDQNLEVIAVAELEGLNVTWCGAQLPVQLIFVNWDTARIVDRFDYGICQLSTDGETVTIGDGYAEDKASKVFRLRRDRPTPLSMRGSIHRYARLTADKYAGWTWWPYDPPCEAFAAMFS